MSLITRVAARVVLALTVAVGTLGSGVAAAQADDQYVKYYTVAPAQGGAKENLTEIAGRVLGDGSRSVEIFNLNVGRPQPDGATLIDGAKLNAGWLLVLPWDAVGAGVRYGVLPDKAPDVAVKPSPAAVQPSATAPPGSGSSSGGQPGSSGGSGPGSAKTSGSKGGNSGGGKCATAAASSGSSNWAGLRLAADKAWPQSKGKGQLVAVVDSGVDGSLPQLKGHVAVGSDLVIGNGRGDTDCLGTGTAMAGLIVAQGVSGGIAGVAPDATVMPVRIAGTGTKVSAQDSASGITAAVSAGATVIALGSYVDTTQKVVTDAIAAATQRNVLVVLGASLDSQAVNPEAEIGEGTLRVAGIGVDSQGAADYRKGGIDVVAPGVNVSSVGITGTGNWTGSGTQYAVAFVAGTAALVRSAYPDLDAEQVAHRIEVTADKMTDGTVPDGSFGYGLINPAASVTRVLPEEATAAGERAKQLASIDAGPGGGRTTLLVIVALVALAAAVLLVFRIRRLLRDDSDAGIAPEEGQAPAEPPHDDPPPPPAAVRPPSVKLTQELATSSTRTPEKPVAAPSPPPTVQTSRAAGSAPTPDSASAPVSAPPPDETADRGVADPKASVGAKSTRAKD
ncbi:S8 family serine peptidase [Micromonospora sp. R77]|uniref:S8 family serine peptidase n=1 Tax=Micromonospora sp. R77 TaxID=2925836 RepID=UPI001F61EBDA|nr:S8 family serine peptidase [Micromonospora sp. R77]MCI4061406.1 S8 family serine peptidase [Micromonospora sp. R77]